MRWLPRLILYLFSNLMALLLAGNFIKGFVITNDFFNLLAAAAVFTLINALIKPVVSFILSPITFLTLGLFSLVINGAMLYLLDIFSDGVTITEIESLIYGTLLITAVNALIHLSAKLSFKKTS